MQIRFKYANEANKNKTFPGIASHAFIHVFPRPRWGGMWVTSHHPVLVGNEWVYPADLGPSTPFSSVADQVRTRWLRVVGGYAGHMRICICTYIHASAYTRAHGHIHRYSYTRMQCPRFRLNTQKVPHTHIDTSIRHTRT